MKTKADQALDAISYRKNEDATIADFKHSQSNTRSYIGYSSIQFRDGNTKARPGHGNPFYALNAEGDGWYRAVEGRAEGYGLAIISVKVTSRKPVVFGDFSAYKAKMNYIPFSKEDESDSVMEDIWLLIQKNFTLDDALSYIKKNSSKWRP